MKLPQVQGCPLVSVLAANGSNGPVWEASAAGGHN